MCALYHEAKARNKPMTRLADELLSAALHDTGGMEIAKEIVSKRRAEQTPTS